MELLILVIAGIGFLYFFKRLKSIENDLSNEDVTTVSYSKIDKLLTDTEAKYYLHLIETISDNYYISCKVRVADVIKHKCKNRKLWFKEFGKMAQKHYDFILFDKTTMLISHAIELDDYSHENRKRKKRDIYLNNLSKEAGLKLLRIPVKNEYINDETIKLLKVSGYENIE